MLVHVKMYIKIPKTNCMTLGSRQNLNRNAAIEIYFESQLIQSMEQQNLLGVVIDRSLTWDKQIDAVNISRRITLLKLLSKYVDMESMKQYYKPLTMVA